MNLSRSRQKQFITLLNIEQIPKMANKHKVPGKTRKTLKRIEDRMEKLEKPFLSASEKSRTIAGRRYVQAISDRSSGSEIRITEHIGTCLRLAEDCREKGAKPKQEWDYLVQSLFTLYQHFDPEIEADNQALAQEMGEKILEQFS